MRGVVILSIFDWWYHSHGHSDVQLAHAFSKTMPVLFVNSIGMRIPRRGTATSPMRRIGRKLRSSARFLKFVGPARLAVLTPLSLPVYSGIFGDLISHFVTLQIKLILWKMGFSKPIILITLPSYAPIALRLPNEAVFYNRSDKHSEFKGVNKERLRRLERVLFSHADAVLYAGQELFEAEKGELLDRALYIGHGLDPDLFTLKGDFAPELASVPRPRVGFFGSLSEQAIDLDLVESVARLCPEINFVLGGPSLDGLERLRQQKNIHLFNGCPHQEMPARWRALDVALLPYRKTEWGRASEPIKLNEILAMRIRAVGTSLPAFRRHPDQVAIADDPVSFAQAIREILATATEEEYSRATRNNKTSFESWDSIAKKIDNLAKAFSGK
jgi:Glycosyl transferases group 1